MGSLIFPLHVLYSKFSNPWTTKLIALLHIERNKITLGACSLAIPSSLIPAFCKAVSPLPKCFPFGFAVPFNHSPTLWNPKVPCLMSYMHQKQYDHAYSSGLGAMDVLHIQLTIYPVSLSVWSYLLSMCRRADSLLSWNLFLSSFSNPQWAGKKGQAKRDCPHTFLAFSLSPCYNLQSEEIVEKGIWRE